MPPDHVTRLRGKQRGDHSPASKSHLVMLVVAVIGLLVGLPQDIIPVNAELDHCIATCRANYNPYTQPTDYYNCVADCKRRFPTRDL
ncbi:MAG: hypothetical protein M1305_06915 [Candidatus Marsarchaeota archaeon]|nr:hypothetical protein [Candidatus Marsarchaeota archaeon]